MSNELDNAVKDVQLLLSPNGVANSNYLKLLLFRLVIYVMFSFYLWGNLSGDVIQVVIMLTAMIELSFYIHLLKDRQTNHLLNRIADIEDKTGQHGRSIDSLNSKTRRQ